MPKSILPLRPSLPGLIDPQAGFDLEHGPAVLLTPGAHAGTVATWEQRRDGEIRLHLTATTGPIRRLRVIEADLDPQRFIPGHTVMKCCGGVSPGDPAPNVRISHQPPNEIDDWKYSDKRKDGVMRYRSEMFALLFCEKTGASLLAGFTEPFHQAARIHADLGPGGDRIRLRCVTYPNFAVATPRRPVVSEWLMLRHGQGPAAPARLFETYLATLEKNVFRAPNAQPPLPSPVGLTGWSDWQYFRRSITQSDVTRNTACLARERYPIQYILIDDGFQKEFGDWTATNRKFPKGLAWLSKYVRDHGFDLGLWIAPLTAGADSNLARTHPDWLVKNRSGEVRVSHSHMGAIVALDFTHPGAQRWLAHLVRTLVRKLHTRWIKLDGPILRYLEHGKFHDPAATPVAMIRTALEIVRREAGPMRPDGRGVIIEGEGYYGPTLGLVDTQRVTQDIQPEWPRMKATTRDNLAGTHFHRRFWVNNPDAFILRDTPSPHRGSSAREHTLKGAELELATTALALTGGVVMLTDEMTILKPRRAALIDTFLPPNPTAARPLPQDFMHSPYPERFELPVQTAFGPWTVGACFNWSDRPRTMTYPLPGNLRNPVVVDFWRQELLPAQSGALQLAVPAHGVRLFSIRSRPAGKAARQPAIVGLIRHITQGGVEISNLRVTGDSLQFDLLPSRAPVVLFLWTGGRPIARSGGAKRSRTTADRHIQRLEYAPSSEPRTIAVCLAK